MGSFRPVALFLLVFWLLVLGLAGARVLSAAPLPTPDSPPITVEPALTKA